MGRAVEHHIQAAIGRDGIKLSPDPLYSARFIYEHIRAEDTRFRCLNEDHPEIAKAFGEVTGSCPFDFSSFAIFW